MKQHKILTMGIIVVLTLLLTGCGPTLEEKITEVQAKNMLTTTDVIDLLELEGVEVEKQKPGSDIHESWEGVEIYKLDGEHLLFLVEYNGYPWDKDNYLYKLNLGDNWAWMMDDTQNESVTNAKKMFKPDNMEYWYSQIWMCKNMIAVYVPALYVIPEGTQASAEVMEERQQQMTGTIEPLKKVLNEYIRGVQTTEYTASGEHFDVQHTLHYAETPYEYNDKMMYEFYENSDIMVSLHDDIAEQCSEKEIKIECRGPLDSPFGEKTRGVGGTINNVWSYSLGASGANIGYGKEPYTGPIQYAVTITIGDDITETLIVGTEGTDSSE